MSEEKLTFESQKVGWNLFRQHEPVFIGNLVLCIEDCSVRIFNISSNDYPSTLSMINSHTEPITCICPFKNQVYTGSLDKTIKLWDLEDGNLIESWIVPGPITYMSIHQNVATVALEDSIIHLDLKNRKAKKIAMVSNVSAFAALGSKVYIGVDNKIRIYPVSDIVMGKRKKDEYTQLVGHSKTTAICVHDSLNVFASAHQGGVILLWSNSTPLILHWHSQTANSITFYENYLVSAGMEGVLVFWHLETKERSFVPRLGSEIYSIGTSLELSSIALLQGDNSLRILSTQSKNVYKTFYGVQSWNKKHISHLRIQPKTNRIVLQSYPGRIQFYDAETNVEQILEVCSASKILMIEFSEDAEWLATVHEHRKEYTLSFYKLNEEYELQTKINVPKINSASFFKNGFFVNTRDDGEFNLWEFCKPVPLQKNRIMHDQDTSLQWRCISGGYYRNMIPKSCCWSHDGSVLAISFSNHVTLWDPLSLELKQTLISPFEIELMCFGIKESKTMIVCCGFKGVTVFDCLSLHQVYHLSLCLSHFAVRDNKIAIVSAPSCLQDVKTKNQELCVFKIKDPKILHLSQVLNVRAISLHSGVVILHKDGTVENLQESKLPTLNVPWPRIAAKYVPKVPVQTKAHLISFHPRARKAADVLNVPAHVLPSISLLFEHIIVAFIE